MNRRRFLRVAIAAGTVSALADEALLPNILILHADQWRGQTLPVGDEEVLQAPSLERLAAEGILCNRAYAANADCTPARASLLTGRFAHACGVTSDSHALPDDVPTLASTARSEGYATGYIGQWRLDGMADPGYVPPGPRRHGFDYWAAFNRGYRYYTSVYFGDTSEPVDGEGFEPDYQTALAEVFVRANANRPFFLMVSWGPPHPPRVLPPDIERMYAPEDFELRLNVPSELADRVRREWIGYYGFCSVIDTCVGRLLSVMDEAGLTERTIVLFTSDHGDMLGSHGLEGAGFSYEEAIRIPLLLRYPRLRRKGVRIEAPVSAVDIVPTLAGLAGFAPPEDVQGQDLSGLMRATDEASSESVFCQGDLGTREEWRLVVRGLDKIVVDRDLQPTGLYNLGQDPYELDNLVSESSQRRRRDELTAILRDWMRRTSDGTLPSGLKTRE